MESLRAPVLVALRAVARHPGQAYLHAHMPPAQGHVFLSVLDDFCKFGAAGVRVGVGGFAALSAGKLIDGHSRLAALDVPQRLVDAADSVVEHRAVLPVGTVVAGLPDIFDAVGGFAEKE